MHLLLLVVISGYDGWKEVPKLLGIQLLKKKNGFPAVFLWLVSFKSALLLPFSFFILRWNLGLFRSFRTRGWFRPALKIQVVTGAGRAFPVPFTPWINMSQEEDFLERLWGSWSLIILTNYQIKALGSFPALRSALSIYFTFANGQPNGPIENYY